MSFYRRYTLLVVVVLGLWFARSWMLQASVTRVIGVTNIPVCSYETQEGAFVLWSEGRITPVEGTDVDMGHPYRTPPASSQIRPVPLVGRGIRGSLGVAVGILPRQDATYVIFSDGSILLPAHAHASAPAPGSDSASTIKGWGWGRSDDYQVSLQSPHLRVNFSDAVSEGKPAWAFGFFTLDSDNPAMLSAFPLSGANVHGNGLVFGTDGNHSPGAPHHGFFVLSE